MSALAEALSALAAERLERRTELRNKGTRYFAQGETARLEADLLVAVRQLVLDVADFLAPDNHAGRVDAINRMAAAQLQADRLAQQTAASREGR